MEPFATGVFRDGRIVRFSRDVEQTVASIAEHDPADAAAYRDFMAPAIPLVRTAVSGLESGSSRGGVAKAVTGQLWPLLQAVRRSGGPAALVHDLVTPYGSLLETVLRSDLTRVPVSAFAAHSWTSAWTSSPSCGRPGGSPGTPCRGSRGCSPAARRRRPSAASRAAAGRPRRSLCWPAEPPWTHLARVRVVPQQTPRIGFLLHVQPPPPARRRAVVPAALLGLVGVALGLLAVLPGPATDVLVSAGAVEPVVEVLVEPPPVRAAVVPNASKPAPKPAVKPAAKKPVAKQVVRPAAKRVSRSKRAVVSAGYACPVDGPHHFTNDWGDARAGHRHQGTDVLAPYGSRVVAVTSGVVKTAYSSSGGVSLYLRGDDGTEYFYAHNASNVASSGERVAAGELIAYVGNSGNARGGPSHVHFERHPGGGAAVNPYPFLSRIC
ncbi:MAG: peptidase family [Frankiales bacterium]|jgi:hypothetical protein|nr:peptidase family [Frankiales bacterium]